MKVKNPVLKGFNPDPSLLRVGEDYYIATSTFEWFPGVCIHHSRDLVNWEIVSYALTDENQVDLTGLDMSCGIWAPNLTYCDGLFYLVYTIVYTDRQRYKDTYNFLVTAKNVRGPWLAPVPLNRSGFDPSLFHDGDKKYLVNMVIDHRVDEVRFCGVDVQEYDPGKKCLVGEPVRVSPGTGRSDTEGPNILKHGDYYYLVLAEGGTRYQHCTTVLRSKSLWGPYEENPHNPVLTSDGQKDCLLERAGHSQVIEGADGNWYMAHLCSRPIKRNSILGRETGIQNVIWTEDGWFKLADNDTGKPEIAFQAPVEVKQNRDRSARVEFAEGKIPLDYMTLRRSFATNGISVKEGVLRIRGGASVMSKYFQGLLARRQQCLDCDFETAMSFAPRHLNHIAGMLVYYNYDNHYYLKMSRDAEGMFLAVSAVVNRELTDSAPVHVPEDTKEVYLRARIRHEELQYFYSLDGESYIPVGPILDMKNISDEHIQGNGFTGSMLGVNCCDTQGDGVYADFRYLDYREFEEP